MSGIESRIDLNLVARYLLNDNGAVNYSTAANNHNRYEDLSKEENNLIFSVNDSYTTSSANLNIKWSAESISETNYNGLTGIGDFGFLKKMLKFGSSINYGNFLLSAKTTDADFNSQELIDFQDIGTLNTKFYDYISGNFSIAYWTQLQVSGQTDKKIVL